jgi:hypothetical protein
MMTWGRTKGRKQKAETLQKVARRRIKIKRDPGFRQGLVCFVGNPDRLIIE